VGKNVRFGSRKSYGSNRSNRFITKDKLKETEERVSSRAAKLMLGYKEYDTQFIQKPKNWKRWRDSQYKPVNKTNTK